MGNASIIEEVKVMPHNEIEQKLLFPASWNAPILDPNLQTVVGMSIIFSLVDPKQEPQLVLQVLVALTPMVDLIQALVSGQHLALLSPSPAETADQATSQRSSLVWVQIPASMHFPL